MHRFTIRIAVTTSLLALGAVAGASRTQAFARPAVSEHFDVQLLRADPKLNDTLTVPPKQLALWFSEMPDLAHTTVSLTTPDHRLVAVGVPRHGEPRDTATRAAIIIPVADVTETGRFTVDWKAAAKDGNASSGSYTFVIAPHSLPKPPER